MVAAGLALLPGRKWSDPAYRTPKKNLGIFLGISKMMSIFIYLIHTAMI